MIFQNSEYIFVSILHAILLFTFASTFMKLLQRGLYYLFPEKIENKSKLQVLIEIYLELICIVVGLYTLRTLVNKGMQTSLKLRSNSEKYALLVLGSPIFVHQRHLLDKIKYVWKDI